MAHAGEGDVERIGSLALELGAAREAREVHEALRRFIQATTPMDGLFVSRYDAERGMRTCAYAFSDGEAMDASALPAMPMNEGPASQAILQARVIVTNDYADVLRRIPRVDVAMDRDPRLPQSSIVVPMVARGRALGAMEIQSPERNAFGDREVAVLQMAAGLAGLALENLALLESAEARVERALADLRRQGVARGLVRELLQGVARRGDVQPESLRSLGRELARGVGGADAAAHVAAYAEMGMGELRETRSNEGRYEFAGRDLLELEPRRNRPTCYLSLGFLEGVVGALTGGAALGTEVACQSQGHAECRFVVRPRPAGFDAPAANTRMNAARGG